MTQRLGRPRRRVLALAGAGGGAAIDAVYLRAIADQGSPAGDRSAFVAVLIAAMALMALLAALRRTDDPFGAAAALAAAGGFVSLGVLGLWSIGLALIVTGLVTLAAAFPNPLSASRSVIAIAAPVVLLAVGLALTG